MTREQERLLEVNLIEYFFDLEKFLQGKKVINQMNVRRPKEAIIKMMQANLDSYLENNPKAIEEEFAQDIKEGIAILKELSEEDYTNFKNDFLKMEPV